MTTPQHAADVLANVATILERADDSPYRVRAYRRTARLLLSTPPDRLPFDPSGALVVPGLGPRLSRKLGDLFAPTAKES